MRLKLCLSLLASILCLQTCLAAVESPQEVARGLIRTLDLQAEMPGKIDHQADREQPAEAPREQIEPSEPPLLWEIPDDVLRVGLWICLIGGVAIIAWSMRDYLPWLTAGYKEPALAPAAPLAPQADRLAVIQDEADSLAGGGRFVEAMHLLLLQSLAEMRKRLATEFADSLTSREILRKSSLNEAGAQSLSQIIHAVERSYFGREPVGQDDYLACRQQFDKLRLALRAGLAA